MKLIDSDALIQRFKQETAPTENGEKYVTLLCALGFSEIKRIIDEQTTVEERKTGKWIHIRDEEGGNALYKCYVCHKEEIHVPIVEVSYCWNCGARMQP